jgi:hypothetical protein
MSLTYKKGDAVRQKVFVIEGAVVDMAIVDGEVQYCVEYVDAAPAKRNSGSLLRVRSKRLSEVGLTDS